MNQQTLVGMNYNDFGDKEAFVFGSYTDENELKTDLKNVFELQIEDFIDDYIYISNVKYKRVFNFSNVGDEDVCMLIIENTHCRTHCEIIEDVCSGIFI